MAKKQKQEATSMQKLTFLVAVLFTIPFSLIYLVFWKSRCVHCGKRIFFNKKVCKKCDINSHAIVDQFDDKIEMFYQQMEIIEDITEIVGQYGYIINQFDGIDEIYNALDEEINIQPLADKTMIYFERTLDSWMDRHLDTFKTNPAFRNEIIEEMESLMMEEPYFKEALAPYLNEIEKLVS